MTKVAEFEHKLEEAKSEKTPVSEEEIFQKMAEIVQSEENEEGQIFTKFNFYSNNFFDTASNITSSSGFSSTKTVF